MIWLVASVLTPISSWDALLFVFLFFPLLLSLLLFFSSSFLVVLLLLLNIHRLPFLEALPQIPPPDQSLLSDPLDLLIPDFCLHSTIHQISSPPPFHTGFGWPTPASPVTVILKLFNCPFRSIVTSPSTTISTNLICLH